MRFFGLILAGAVMSASLSGCNNPAQQQAALVAVISGLDCAADGQAIKGKSLALAQSLAHDPNCLTAINAAIAAAGNSASATVVVTPAK